MQNNPCIKDLLKPCGFMVRPFARFGLILIFTGSICGWSGCSKSAASNSPHQNKKTPASSAADTSAMGYMADQKGVILHYTITSGDEAGATSLVSYTAVKDSAGYLLANLESEAAGIKIYSSVYHNKENTYALQSFPALYYAALATLAQAFTSFTHQESPLVMSLPHKDPLHKIVFPATVTASWHGLKTDNDSQMDTRMTQTEGKAVIDSIGNITTAAGLFKDCIRVHYLRTQKRTTTISSSTDNFSQDDATEFDNKIWYAKGIGVVKTLELNLKTAVTTVTELSKIEQPQ